MMLVGVMAVMPDQIPVPVLIEEADHRHIPVGEGLLLAGEQAAGHAVRVRAVPVFPGNIVEGCSGEGADGADVGVEDVLGPAAVFRVIPGGKLVQLIPAPEGEPVILRRGARALRGVDGIRGGKTYGAESL